MHVLGKRPYGFVAFVPFKALTQEKVGTASKSYLIKKTTN
jgi:hypothetical protein